MTMRLTSSGYLGIDVGTQGLSVVFSDCSSQRILAQGEGSYSMLPGLEKECYEQLPSDWELALTTAMADLRVRMDQINLEMNILAIGISGQMHGEVLADNIGQSLGPARLWCDTRNDAEAHELTALFGVKMPRRITAARWLWTIRNWSLEKCLQVSHITTPAGWIAYRLTGEWCLGIGDASGMFPIDQSTLNYDSQLLAKFDALVAAVPGRHEIPPLLSLLPTVRRVGQDGGVLHAEGAILLLGLPLSTAGIPVSPAEGDQPASMAGSLIAESGMVSVSFGTSVVANSIGDRLFQGISPSIDHFCAPDGKPINMVWLRNGTTPMNRMIKLFSNSSLNETDLDTNLSDRDVFVAMMRQTLDADIDCEGIVSLPFIDGEPGCLISRGGNACIVGLNETNATPANIIRSMLTASIFNLRMGSDVLLSQGYPMTQIILSGGLTKSPEVGQIVADIFETPVVIMDGATEGTAWGAALMAEYRHRIMTLTSNTTTTPCSSHKSCSQYDWTTFLSTHSTGTPIRFNPNIINVAIYSAMYRRYCKLLKLHQDFDEVP